MNLVSERVCCHRLVPMIHFSTGVEDVGTSRSDAFGGGNDQVSRHPDSCAIAGDTERLRQWSA